jgi:RNA polymerase sigma factor (sigma-70 family)
MVQTAEPLEYTKSDDFVVLLKELEWKIARMASRKVSNEQDIKDITQEALIRVYRSYHTFDANVSKIETWVYRIVHNLCIDYHRRRKHVDYLGGNEFHLQSNQNVEKEIESYEFSVTVNQALLKLPNHYRKAFTMKHIQEKSLNEISEELNLPVNTIKSHIFRAKSSLQIALKEYSTAS